MTDPEVARRIENVQTACVWEATARKVGNVHPRARFADLSYSDFLDSSGAISVAFSFPTGSGQVGRTIYDAVEFTATAVGKNTNLGIILLLAPLAHSYCPGPWRGTLEALLNDLTVEDTQSVYRAIRRASPGGLGTAPEQDVAQSPTVPLREAMALAADRDLIARQYQNGFADVFDFGVPAFLAAFQQYQSVEAAIIECQFRWLAAFQDSLIARKNGPAVAETVRQRAAEVVALGGMATPEGRAAGMAFDGYLRTDGHQRNPGTTADLIAACLFVALQESKVKSTDPFRWAVPDWL